MRGMCSFLSLFLFLLLLYVVIGFTLQIRWKGREASWFSPFITMASNIPHECLHLILDFIWQDDRWISQFANRQRARIADYCLSPIQPALNRQLITPIHICAGWRQALLRRYFRTTAIHKGSRELPRTACAVTERLLVFGTEEMDLADLQTCLRHRMPRARILALCLMDSSSLIEQTDSTVQVLSKRLPNLESIWFETQTKALHPQHYHLVHRLLQSSGAELTWISLQVLNRRSHQAIRLIHLSSHCLRFLSIQEISGGVLGDLLYRPNTDQQIIYLQLRRILFAVDAQLHIYANLPSYHRCPFPALEALHFDDTQLNGMPRDDWYPILYDVFLKHQMRLRYLTFPIVYNTQRMVGYQNCPSLVYLRHIKCGWATGGPWDTQRESDSTRVLKSITTIPTLRHYIHPSFIARLTDVPSRISCLSLRCLDLYGWPLTLENTIWVIRTMECLCDLTITLSATPAQITNNDKVGLVERLYRSSVNTICRSPLSKLAIGCIDQELNNDELPVLLDLLLRLPQLSNLSLYTDAYGYLMSRIELHYFTQLFGTNVCNIWKWAQNLNSLHHILSQPSANRWYIEQYHRLNPPTELEHRLHNSWHLVNRVLIGE